MPDLMNFVLIARAAWMLHISSWNSRGNVRQVYVGKKCLQQSTKIHRNCTCEPLNYANRSITESGTMISIVVYVHSLTLSEF